VSCEFNVFCSCMRSGICRASCGARNQTVTQPSLSVEVHCDDVAQCVFFRILLSVALGQCWGSKALPLLQVGGFPMYLEKSWPGSCWSHWCYVAAVTMGASTLATLRTPEKSAATSMLRRLLCEISVSRPTLGLVVGSG
jgi:hypothetical protein